MRRLYYVWNGLMRYLLFHPRVRDRLFAVEMDPDERVGVLGVGVAAAIQLNFVPPLRDVVIHNGARYFLYLFLRLFRRPDGYLCAKLAVQVLDVLLGRVERSATLGMAAHARERRRTFVAEVRKIVVVRQLGTARDVLRGEDPDARLVGGRVDPPLRLAIRMAAAIDETSDGPLEFGVDDVVCGNLHHVKVFFARLLVVPQTRRALGLVENLPRVLDDEGASANWFLDE